MPKREKTPPPAADEPKYLTVVHPYPPHANLELVGEQKELAYWLASCTGKDPLLAFFYKPRSPDTIIIEVDREFQHWDRLLGAHPWSSVFKNPPNEYKSNVTKIFYCTFSTGRQVQKYGWKRVNVQEHWFLSWSPINRHVNFPYPKTVWCKVPAEDATNTPLCRPLPVSHFTPPQDNSRPPPVGAEGWQEARKPTTPTNNPWKKGPPTVNTQNLNRTSSIPAATSPASATSTSSNGGRPNAWNANNGANAGIAAPTPGYGPPPGLPPPGGFAASTPSGTYHTAPSTAWTVTSGSSRASSSAGSDSDGGSIGGTPTPSEFHDVESIVGRPDMASVMQNLNLEENYWETATDDWDSGSRSYDEHYTEAPEEPVEDLWANDPPPPPEPVEKDKGFLCPEHGKLCTKGICREYKAWLRRQERMKQEEERAAALASKKNKKKTTRTHILSPIIERPPHLTRGRAPPAPLSETHSETVSEVQSEQTPPEAEGTSDPEKLEFNARSRPPHLMRDGPSKPKDGPSPISPTSSSSSATSPTSPRPTPAPTVRTRPAHLMKGASAPAAAKTPSTSINFGTVNQEAGSSTRAPPSDSGWGHISRDPWGGKSINGASVKGDDAKSAVSSTGGWGRVSNGPWGSGSVNGKAKPGKGKGKASGQGAQPQSAPPPAPSAPSASPAPDDAPKKSWADQMEEDDDRSVVSSSTGGWGKVSNGPW